MHHPYREPASSKFLEEWPGVTGCWCCERRAAMARVRHRRLWGLLAIAFMATPIAWLPVVFAYTRLAARVAAIEKLDAAAIEANRLSRAAAPPPPPPSPSPSPPAPPPANVPALPVELGILKLSETAFVIDRSVIARALEWQAERMSRYSVGPDVEEGKVVGIRLFGVRPDSLLGLIGFENGDRLESINGLAVLTPDRALEAYARFRTADDLSVVVMRRGSKVRLRYHLVWGFPSDALPGSLLARPHRSNIATP
jgi:membrane-associated protease RseP (regulator of RpoE activity)